MQAKPIFYNSKHFKNFWESGTGKDLLDWAGFTPDIQNFEKYAHLYYLVDETGDAAVRETYLSLSYPQASAIIDKASKQQITTESNLGPAVKDLFLQMQQVPAWYNEELARKGARFCMRSGVNSLIILRDFSLMGGYDYAYLNKPLIFTGILKKGAVKRLKDTLAFWIHVTRENGLKIHSEAYQLVVRTRLMHSYARLQINKKRKDWDVEKWGEPINFWDMTATYTGFSLVLMQGLRKLGIEISDEEEKGSLEIYRLSPRYSTRISARQPRAGCGTALSVEQPSG